VEILGQYALALAIATPVMMLSHLNLRAVLATDVAHRHPFADYLTVRIGASLVALAALAVSSTSSATVLLGASLAAESFSDLYYGVMQRNGRLDLVARSMILRAAVTLAGVAAALWWRTDATTVAAALLLARAATLIAYDLPHAGARYEGRDRPGEVLRAALPLGFVLMLVSLTANVPRYAIEKFLGTRELGAFAAVASFATTGAAVVNALGQSAVTRLARHFEAGESRAFRQLGTKLVLLAAALGLAGVAVAAFAGEVFLRLIYRPEYAAYAPLLVAMLAAATLGYAAQILGYISTSTRAFALQMPLLALVAGVCAAASFATVPRFGLYGAALAIGASACVQIAGQLWILRRGTLRRAL
jgi:O-antigen/teichoic acid export membrane protein